MEWVDISTISNTMGVNSGRICIGDGDTKDIGCPTYAPIVSSGGLLTGTTGAFGGLTVTGNSNLANVSATNISTTALTADKAQIASAQAGTLAVDIGSSANTSTGIQFWNGSSFKGGIYPYGNLLTIKGYSGVILSGGNAMTTTSGPIINMQGYGVLIGTHSHLSAAAATPLEVRGTISASNVYVTETTGTISGSYGHFRYVSASNVAVKNISTTNISATAYSGSGALLTALNASNLSTGTVATARLGSGTATSATYLRGDGTWSAVSGGSSGATTSMSPDWPDAIYCTDINSGAPWILYLANPNWGGDYWYIRPYNYTVGGIGFNSSGNYITNSDQDFGGENYSNCRTNIASIVSDGRGFNFLGGGGAGDGSPGGANTQVQFNSSDVFAGSASFTWNNTYNRLTATNVSVTALTVNGTAITGSGGTPGGSDTQIQYNNSSAFGGSANFTWNNSYRRLAATNVSATNISATAYSGSGALTASTGAFGGLTVTGNTSLANVSATNISATRVEASSHVRFGSALYSGGLSSFYIADNIGTGHPGINFDATDFIDYDRSSNLMRFGIGSVRAVIESTGDFGIGTTNPNAKLDVVGTISATALTINGVSITGSGGTPGGSDTQIQYNNSSAFGGSANFTWNNSYRRLAATNVSATNISATAVHATGTSALTNLNISGNLGVVGWLYGNFIEASLIVGETISAQDLYVDGHTSASTISATAITINGTPVGGSAVDVQVFDSSGTWTSPESGSVVLIECWGGGGGGGMGTKGGGGGGGAYVGKWVPIASLGSSIAVTVGTGGAGVSSGGGNTAGSNGGTSSVFIGNVNDSVYARGGAGGGIVGARGGGGGGMGYIGAPDGPTQGLPNIMGQGAGSSGATLPAAAGTGAIYHGGGGGHGGNIADANGGDSVYGGGGGAGNRNGATQNAGGMSIYGGAGGLGGGTTNNGFGVNGTAPGGGGGGSNTSYSSGDGANGRCILRTF